MESVAPETGGPTPCFQVRAWNPGSSNHASLASYVAADRIHSGRRERVCVCVYPLAGST